MATIDTPKQYPRIHVSHLRYGAAALAYLLAVLYLFHPTLGMAGLVAYVASGTPLIDPRPAALVASAIALIVGVKLALIGYPRRPLYLGGMALLVAHLAGYVLWHATGHGGFLPWVEPHTHNVAVLDVTVTHLLNDRWSLVTKTVEAVLLGLLFVLFLRDS